jgi:phosphoribosylpyrophosphate synthetase
MPLSNLFRLSTTLARDDEKTLTSHGPSLTWTSCRLGIQVARTISLNYSNQETSFTVGESVRDEDVFIVQSTATGDVNEGLMELLIMISACRTASARRITAVMYVSSPRAAFRRRNSF